MEAADMDKMQKLDEILKTYEEEMTETLRGLVRIPSVDGEPLPASPLARPAPAPWTTP